MALWGPIWALPLRVQLPRDLMPTRSVAMPVSWQHRPRDHQSEAWLSEGLQGLLRPGPPPSSLNGGNRRTGTIAPLAVGAGRGTTIASLGHLDPAGCGNSHSTPRQKAIASDNASAAMACLTAGALAAGVTST